VKTARNAAQTGIFAAQLTDIVSERSRFLVNEKPKPSEKFVAAAETPALKLGFSGNC
jgi:hypothetical protein